MKQTGKKLLIILSSLFIVIGTASADPYKDESGNGRGKSAWKQDRGGPPPWAPAHGYRRDRDRDYDLARLPIDIASGRCNREVIGQVLGGAAGAVIGSGVGDGDGRLIAVAAGTLAGVIIGGEIGRAMDRTDALCLDQSLEYAPDGSRIIWTDNERQYAVTPKETYQDREGRYCREYTMDAQVGDQTQQVYGTACRQPDGSWRMVKT